MPTWALLDKAGPVIVRSQSGLFDALVAAMAAHQADAVIHQKALGALFNLAVVPDNKDAIRNASGIEAILRSLQVHRHQALIQRNACWALWNLAAGSEPNRERIFHLHGIEAVVQTLHNHRKFQEVCEKALGVLDNLGVDGVCAGCLSQCRACT